MNLQLISESASGLVNVMDENENTFWMPKLHYLNFITPKIKSIKNIKNRKKFTPSLFSWFKIVDILKNDKNFRMPISVPPIDEELVLSEVGTDSGTTLASDRKIMTSYDVVFSANPELEVLLKESGITSVSFYNHQGLRLAHGPRKAFYMKLLDSGFEPTKLGD